MKRPKRSAPRHHDCATVHRLPEGAELILSGAETAVLVVRGACMIRAQSGKLERVTAGTFLLGQGEAKSVDRPVSRALALMQAEPAKRWTVERLARAVGLSRAAFARRFVAHSGRLPQRFLTELRLALAATTLLEQGEASLAEVASQVGYASEFAFSRAFKRHHGLAPGLFRRRHALAGAAITLLAAA